jgi:ribosomal-protein-alanine N-acetyltransferase
MLDFFQSVLSLDNLVGNNIPWRIMSIDSVFQSMPSLETRRLILRRLHEADANALFSILGDDEVTRYYDDATFTAISQAREQITAWENGFLHRRCIRWGITRKEDGVLIGTCGYYGIHPWHMRASIGYELGRQFWHQGLMTEALNAIINLGFKEMSLNRIDALVMPENIPSIRLLEKIGFKNEGLLREYENWGSKGFTDLYILALLRTYANL